tara:strand:+ start:47 stop:349 length:303 start_codon:yes stop_codon:yes gene_type:complete
MSFDINNLARTASITVLGLLIAVPLSINLKAGGEQDRAASAPDAVDVYLTDMRANLVEACVDYNISPVDSKLEREAKTAIDNYFDGDKVNYKAVCTTVFG